MTRIHASTFYFASHVLRPEKRWAAYAVYAFCRHVDDVIDESSGDMPTRESLEAELDRIFGGQSTLPFAPAVAAAAAAYGIPRQLFSDLIHGCCLDQQPMEVQSFSQLAEYCYYVASVVGLMMARIFGLKDADGVPRAVEMGIAMQLTNILRDVREDFERGRVYLPADELHRHGLTKGSLQARMVNRQWYDFMRFQVDRARQYYASAEQGVDFLDPGGPQLATRLMSRLYAEILTVIEARNYDVFKQRAYVPLHHKVRLAVGVSSRWSRGGTLRGIRS